MKRFCISLFLLVASIFATTAQAQVTSLSISGLGQPIFVTSADGSFSAFSNFDSEVSLSFFGSNHFFFLDFAAPNNAPLTVGTYPGATRFPFQAPGEPGLDVSFDGSGCNTLTGSFTVQEAVYDANGVVSFDATFEQFCDASITPIDGEIRFNAHPNVSVTAPSHLTVVQNQNVHFTVTAADAQSRHVALSASGVPAGATFVDNGDNTGTFNWTPSGSIAGNFFVTFQGDNLSGNTGLAVTDISIIPLPPPNDDFNAPTVIPSMPFTTSQNVTNATAAFDDPFCVGHSQTVWFAFTPTQNMVIEANTFGSNYDTTLSVYTGSRGSLTQLACNDDSGSLQSRIRFNAVAGTTYYFMVSSFSFFPVSNANLVFNLLPGPQPLAIAPSIFQFGSVDPSTGAATISGFVSCSQQAFVTISGQLKQTHGPSSTFGFFSVFVPCNGTTPWSASIQTIGQTFHGRALADLFTGGPADVTASASAFDFQNGVFVQRNFAVRINLRGK
jgi:VCBS repeat-containing protein